jgi:hypothetical protein
MREAVSRRSIFAWLGALGALFVARLSRAEEVAVPTRLQADLLARVAGYDRNLPARAGDRVRVLLFAKPADSESTRIVAQMKSALGEIDRIADLPHEEAIVPYVDGRNVADECRSRRAAIVYFGPGFEREVETIRAALDGSDVLSVSAVAGDVPRGIVLGFDLVSSRPKLLVNLTQARRQNIAFRAEVLKMMRVFE